MSNFAAKDLTAGQLNALVKKVGGHDNVLALLSGELKFQLLSSASQEAISVATNNLTVPDTTLTEAIALGQYDWTNSEINEARFPITVDQLGDFEYELFHFGHSISSERAIKEMKTKGFDPAQTGQILAFGVAFPEEQRKYPIVALGSSAEVRGYRHVLVLHQYDGQRRLSLIWFGRDWGDDYRFLGVRRRFGT